MNTSPQATSRCVCYNFGPLSIEPLSNQPGHLLQVGNTAGHWEGGVFDGCVMTATTIWSFEQGTNGTLVAGLAVLRKPGLSMVVEQTGGTSRLTITDGVPSAWEATATGRVKLATGAAAQFQGSEIKWTGKLGGFAHFVLEARIE